MSDFIFVLDSEGRITSCKVAGELAASAERLVGQHYSILYPEQDRSAVAGQALQTATRAGIFHGEVRLVRSDASPYTAAVTIEPLRAGQGQEAGFVMLARQAHAQQLDSEAAASALRQAIGKSVHGLNNTLQVLRNGIDLLCRIGPAGSERPMLVDMITRNVEQASSLMQQLLAQVGHGTGQTAAARKQTDAASEDNGDNDHRLNGLRVIVAEDESLIGMFVEDLLDQLGCRIVGLVTNVGEALDAVSRVEMDCALLDINLQGKASYAVAQALQAKSIPFVFMSGQQRAIDPWADRPLVQKPFDLEQLRQEIVRALGLK